MINALDWASIHLSVRERLSRLEVQDDARNRLVNGHWDRAVNPSIVFDESVSAHIGWSIGNVEMNPGSVDFYRPRRDNPIPRPNIEPEEELPRMPDPLSGIAFPNVAKMEMMWWGFDLSLAPECDERIYSVMGKLANNGFMVTTSHVAGVPGSQLFRMQISGPYEQPRWFSDNPPTYSDLILPEKHTVTFKSTQLRDWYLIWLDSKLGTTFDREELRYWLNI